MKFSCHLEHAKNIHTWRQIKYAMQLANETGLLVLKFRGINYFNGETNFVRRLGRMTGVNSSKLRDQSLIRGMNTSVPVKGMRLINCHIAVRFVV